MRTIYIGDLHIDEKSIPELTDIFREIFSYGADRAVQLGDWYDSNKSSPLELDFGTGIAKQMVDIYKDVTILDGNGRHSVLHGESVTRYLHHLGIKTVGIEHETIIDNKRILLGHFMLNESKLEYGSGKYGIKDLKDYDYVLLGHQHSSQTLVENKIFHLGSCRFQNFNEVNDPYKQIAIIDDGVLTFIPLKSPTPMVQLIGDTNHFKKRLEELNPKTKVKVIIPSFSIFKNSIEVIKPYKNKFVDFKVALEFEKNLSSDKVIAKKESNNLDEVMMEEIKNIKDSEVRELLEAQFKEV